MDSTKDNQTPYTPTPWYLGTFNCINADDGSIVVDLTGVMGGTGDPNADISLITTSVNSYAKHCGPNAIQCAEDDLLGQALEALRTLKNCLWLDTDDQIYKVPPGYTQQMHESLKVLDKAQ